MTEIEETKAAFYRVSAKVVELAKENEALRAELAKVEKFRADDQEFIHETWHKCRMKLVAVGDLDEYGGLEGMLDELIAKYIALRQEKGLK